MEKKEKEAEGLPIGSFYDLDLEGASITSIYNLLTRSQSRGYTYVQGRLRNIDYFLFQRD